MAHLVHENQEYLTPRLAAEYLGIGYSTFLRDYPRLIRDHGLEVSRYGNKMLRVKRSSLDRLMKALTLEV